MKINLETKFNIGDKIFAAYFDQVCSGTVEQIYTYINQDGPKVCYILSYSSMKPKNSDFYFPSSFDEKRCATTKLGAERANAKANLEDQKKQIQKAKEKLEELEKNIEELK